MSSDDFEFPPRFARGITDEEWGSETPPYQSAFLFDEEDRGRPRADGYRELSVTWLSDPEALGVLMSTDRRGEPMFLAGVGIVRRSIVDDLKSRHGEGKVSYEYHPSRKNRYHGNILIGRCSILEERAIAAKLAMSATFYRYGEDVPWKEQT